MILKKVFEKSGKTVFTRIFGRFVFPNFFGPFNFQPILRRIRLTLWMLISLNTYFFSFFPVKSQKSPTTSEEERKENVLSRTNPVKLFKKAKVFFKVSAWKKTMWRDYRNCMTNCRRKRCQKCKRFWRKKGVKRKKRWPIPIKMSAFNADNLVMFWVIVHRQPNWQAKRANVSSVALPPILLKIVNQNWKELMLTGNLPSQNRSS